MTAKRVYGLSAPHNIAMSFLRFKNYFLLKNISLYWVMLIPFVVQIFGAVGLVGYLSYRTSESAIDKLATQIMNEVGDRIDQNIITYLSKPNEINRNNAASIKLGILDWKNLKAVEKYFWQQSKIFANVSSVAIANEQKEILIVEKLDNGSRAIRLRDQSTNYNWDNYLADDNGDRIQLLRRSSTYDPHNDPPNNPWYRQTKNEKRSLWRLNVSLANPQAPTLIAINFQPFFDRDNNFQGVLGASVSLAQLSDFLQKLKIGKTGQAFILERNGKLIGVSTGTAPFRQGLLAPLTPENTLKNVDPNNRRLSALESNNVLTKDIYQYLMSRFEDLYNITERQQFRVKKNGIAYFVQVLPLRSELTDQDLDWLAVIVIPESDFMTEIQANANLTILLSGLILFISIWLGLITGRWISRPILRLSDASIALAKGEWQNLSEDMAIAEFKTLAKSFNSMSEQLHEAFVQVENSLRESEDKFATIFQVSPDPIWISTLSEGKYLYVNQSLCHFLGISQSDIIGNTFMGLDLWNNVEDIECYWQKLSTDGYIQNFEVEIRTALGDLKTVLISASLVYLDGQDCEIGIMKDISDRQQTELNLRENRAKLREAYTEQNTLLGALTDVVLVRNREGRCLKVAQTKSLYLKGSREEVLSKPIHEELPEDTANIILETIQKALLTKQMASCDYVLDIDGRELWFSSNISPLTEDTVIQISRDITDRKLSEITLAKAKEEAEAATKAKSEFLSNMSHEIRTPMNGVLVMAQILATTELDEDQQDLVKTIVESGDFLLTIINDILDFSKIESGMLELENKEFVLIDVVKSVYDLLNSQAITKKIDLQYAIAPDIPTKVMGDSSRLRQILINLTGNAIKFTQQGSIAIAVTGTSLSEPNKYQLKFTVRDTGIGIQSDRIGKLFQAFTQADTSTSRKYGGTGLGLAISKRLVELMGGTIWVESLGAIGGFPPSDWQSELVTQGSVFYFIINVNIA
jgi:PAS domain S-box-containing protein